MYFTWLCVYMAQTAPFSVSRKYYGNGFLAFKSSVLYCLFVLHIQMCIWEGERKENNRNGHYNHKLHVQFNEEILALQLVGNTLRWKWQWNEVENSSLQFNCFALIFYLSMIASYEGNVDIPRGTDYVKFPWRGSNFQWFLCCQNNFGISRMGYDDFRDF